MDEDKIRKVLKTGLEALATIEESLIEASELMIEGEGATPPDRIRKKKGTKKKKKASAKKKKEPVVTEDQVRKAFFPIIDEFGNKGAKDVLKEFDTRKISELDESDYARAIEAAKEYLAENSEAEEEEDDEEEDE